MIKLNVSYPFGGLKSDDLWKVTPSLVSIFKVPVGSYLEVSEGRRLWNEYFKQKFLKGEMENKTHFNLSDNMYKEGYKSGLSVDNSNGDLYKFGIVGLVILIIGIILGK